jgi:hypothetical protein
LGLPGALPVLNVKVVEFAAKAALALGLNINETSIFSRKNYFYPDLPKGYQISQYDKPFSSDGKLRILTAERDEGGHARNWQPLEIGITRLHLEEDAGKNVHEGLPDTDEHLQVQNYPVRYFCSDIVFPDSNALVPSAYLPLPIFLHEAFATIRNARGCFLHFAFPIRRAKENPIPHNLSANHIPLADAFADIFPNSYL